MSDWQPISTAPKDGTQVLLHDGFNAQVCFWGEGHPTAGHEDEKAAWRMVWDNTILVDADDREDVYWMPIPDPPTPDSLAQSHVEGREA